jgi:hypothetical protein
VLDQEGDRTGLRHPRYDLEDSIRVAETLFNKSGGTATADALAHFLGHKSAANGTYFTKVVAARLFGLIDGPPKAIRATPRAEQILRPDYDWVAKRAKFEAFYGVPLFKAFLDLYEGKPLPQREGMLNTLTLRFGITKETSAVLDRLLDSADEAGLFDITGDRSKMIRPALGQTSAPAVEAQSEGRLSEPLSVARVAPSTSSGLKSHGKLLDGMWEELPDESAWDDESLTYWLDTFERLLRVRYKVPKSAT